MAVNGNFNIADVCAMQPAHFCKLFLRNCKLGSVFSHIGAKYFYNVQNVILLYADDGMIYRKHTKSLQTIRVFLKLPEFSAVFES